MDGATSSEQTLGSGPDSSVGPLAETARQNGSSKDPALQCRNEAQQHVTGAAGAGTDTPKVDTSCDSTDVNRPLQRDAHDGPHGANALPEELKREVSDSDDTCSDKSLGSRNPTMENMQPAQGANVPTLPGGAAPEKGTVSLPKPADDNVGSFTASPSGLPDQSPPSKKGATDAALQDDRQWHESADTNVPHIIAKDRQIVRVFCGVWNLHGKQAPPDIGSWLLKQPMHHMYVIGTCECERSIQKSLIWANKARWEQQVRSHLGQDYFMIGSHNMSAIHIMVFVHRYLWKFCWDIKTAQVATGFANLVGNKGGTQVGFSLGHTSVLCVNAHLPAHKGKMKDRTQSMARIFADSPLRQKKSGSGVHEEYDKVFFMGDLNPRLTATRETVDDLLAKKDLGKCLEKDELLPLLKANVDAGTVDSTVGMWPMFEEAAITFPPTYKFDSNSDNYDSSKKLRVPAWTDRILWKRDAGIKVKAYSSVDSLKCSDHRPVFAQFEVSVDLQDWQGPVSHKEERSSICSVQ